MDRTHDDRKKRIERLERQAKALMKKLNGMKPEQVGEFLKLDVLAETLDRRVGQVGRYERSVYFDGFQVLIDEEFELGSMEPCWRAN
jgi:hypothetical protein